MKAGQGYPAECIAAIRQRSKDRTEVFPAIFWSNVSVGDVHDCWPWKAMLKRNGYGEIKRGGKPALTHRVAYEITYGPIPDGMHVAHKCDNKPCCNPLHLEVATPQKNSQDAIARGLKKPMRGELNGMYGRRPPNAKLTQDQADSIRESYTKGIYTQKQLAKRFSVSQRTISLISLNRIWLNHEPR